MQNKYAFICASSLYSVNNIFQFFKIKESTNKLGNKLYLIFFLMLTTLGYSQLTTENFERIFTILASASASSLVKFASFLPSSPDSWP